MGRIKIRKIDNQAARQVTFSKRRRGLFKKGDELAVLCGADVATIIFSNAGRPYTYSSSSINDIVKKYEINSNKSRGKEVELELLHRNYDMLCTQALKSSNELMQLNGENIQGLDLEELISLEDKVEMSLNQVKKTKDKHVIKGISIIQQQRNQLIEENNKLKEMLKNNNVEGEIANNNGMQEMGQLSESSYSDPLHMDDFSVALNLGLPYF